MPSNVERVLGSYQNNREAVAKWAAIVAIAWVPSCSRCR